MGPFLEPRCRILSETYLSWRSWALVKWDENFPGKSTAKNSMRPWKAHQSGWRSTAGRCWNVIQVLGIKATTSFSFPIPGHISSGLTRHDSRSTSTRSGGLFKTGKLQNSLDFWPQGRCMAKSNALLENMANNLTKTPSHSKSIPKKIGYGLYKEDRISKYKTFIIVINPPLEFHKSITYCIPGDTITIIGFS